MGSVLFFPFPVAWGYRPFVSTDSAVDDLKEMEIESGTLIWNETGVSGKKKVSNLGRENHGEEYFLAIWYFSLSLSG